ncbi:MAG: hypothetical protein U0U70_15210 [Chitinophagaceae bacterium]
MKYKLDQPVFIDQEKVSNISDFLGTLIPFLNKVIAEFKELGIGKFSHDDLTDILKNGGNGIKAKYKDIVSTELKKMGSHVSRVLTNQDVLDNALEAFTQSILKMNIFIDGRQNTPMVKTALEIRTSFDHLRIVNEKPEFSLETITESATVSIKTEDEAELMNRLASLKEAHDNLSDFLKEQNFPKRVPIWGDHFSNNALTSLDEEDGHLVIDPCSIIYMREARPQ